MGTKSLTLGRGARPTGSFSLGVAVALEGRDVGVHACQDGVERGEIIGDGVAVFEALGAQCLFHLVDLIAPVDVFDGLFDAYGDEESEDDGGDVDEEIAPGGGGVVGGVDVEHGGGILGRGGFGRFLGVRWGQRDGVWLGHELVATSVTSLSWAGMVTSGFLLRSTVLRGVQELVTPLMR